jgi:DNA-binding IscR family transcriptional regulator
LSKAPETISLAAILRVLDGPIAPVPCLSKTAYRRCDGCTDEATCAVRMVLREAYDASVEVLERTTLADVAKNANELSREPTVMRYSI